MFATQMAVRYPALDPVVIVNGATVLAFPPIQYGDVTAWNTDVRKVLEFDLEVWAEPTACNLTVAELLAGALKAGVIADDVFDAVVNATDKITLTGHALETGDGPVQLTTSGVLPAPLAVSTDYWVIKVDANTIKLATTLSRALAGTAIDLTTDGSGTNTLVDTADTKKMKWESAGFLGSAGSGAVTLTERKAYRVRCAHHQGVVAYALTATLSAAVAVYASLNPVAAV